MPNVSTIFRAISAYRDSVESTKGYQNMARMRTTSKTQRIAITTLPFGMR